MSKNTRKLVGCIDTLTSVIRTRFFYVNVEEHEVRDVTMELCEAIDEYNQVAKDIRSTGDYSMMIPFEYRYGLAEYGFGCGLSHYLQEEEFERIVNRFAGSGRILSFPLVDCKISMFTPDDVQHILSCNGVFDQNMVESLKERYGISKEV